MDPTITTSSNWRVRDIIDLGVIGATHGLSDGFSGLLKPVLALIVIDLGLSTFEAGALLSIFALSTFLFLTPVSLLADYGGQKKLILVVGMGVAAAAFFAMQWASGFGAVAVLAFLAGAGNAVFHPCGTAITAERFPQRRAVAVSFYSMMGNAGASLMPIVQSMLAMAVGWRTATAACTLPALLLLPLLAVRFPNRSVRSFKAKHVNSDHDRRRQQVWALTRLVLKNRSVVLLAIIYALAGMGTGVVTGFLSLLAVEHFALETATIGVAIALYYGAGVVAKPLMGYLYDRYGARSALWLPLLLAGTLTLTVIITPWTITFVPLIALLGAVVPISPIILTAAADHSDENALASSVGFIYTCYGLSFVSTLIGGWLAEQLGLSISYLFAAILIWGGAGTALFLPASSATNIK